VSYSESTAIVAAICESDIEVTSGISDEPGCPYHSFTATQMRKNFIPMWNVDLDAVEIRVATKRTQGVIAKPVCINRYDFKPLVDQMGTQSTP
jgi:hypothetical protein